MSEKKVTKSEGKKEEWVDLLGDKQTRDETTTTVNGKKTEGGKV